MVSRAQCRPRSKQHPQWRVLCFRPLLPGRWVLHHWHRESSPDRGLERHRVVHRAWSRAPRRKGMPSTVSTAFRLRRASPWATPPVAPLSSPGTARTGRSCRARPLGTTAASPACPVPPARSCVAVGSYSNGTGSASSTLGRTLVESWNGRAWSVVPVASPWCRTSTACPVARPPHVRQSVTTPAAPPAVGRWPSPGGAPSSRSNRPEPVLGVSVRGVLCLGQIVRGSSGVRHQDRTCADPGGVPQRRRLVSRAVSIGATGRSSLAPVRRAALR